MLLLVWLGCAGDDDRGGCCSKDGEFGWVSSCVEVCPAGPSEDDVTCAENAAADAVACGDFDCWGFCS